MEKVRVPVAGLCGLSIVTILLAVALLFGTGKAQTYGEDVRDVRLVRTVGDVEPPDDPREDGCPGGKCDCGLDGCSVCCPKDSLASCSNCGSDDETCKCNKISTPGPAGLDVEVEPIDDP